METNIYNTAYEIFRYEPAKTNSIRLDIINQTDSGMIFEILAILMCEGLKIKLPNVIQNNRNINNFINTLKQYFQSFSMDFDYEILEDDEEINFGFYNFLNFQANVTYELFKIKTQFKYYDFFIPYEPGIHNSTELKDYLLCIKIGDLCFRIQFKFLR